jgi:hypothetical protein
MFGHVKSKRKNVVYARACPSHQGISKEDCKQNVASFISRVLRRDLHVHYDTTRQKTLDVRRPNRKAEPISRLDLEKRRHTIGGDSLDVSCPRNLSF